MKPELKILILEDSISDTEFIQRLLNKELMNCKFSLAMNKDDFLHALEEFSPDVILSDNSLPQFNSPEALKLARRRLPHIPFILVTGMASEEFVVDIMKSGADDCILKDRMARLPAAIEAALKQRRAEKEIMDYRYALDQSAIVAITDQKGIISYANENFCTISKYSVEELIGRDHRIINSGYHPASYIKNLWTTIASGKIWRGEFLNKAKDGSLYWVDTTVIPSLNEKGKPYQYLSIRLDITEKKISEEKLRQNEIRLNEAQAITHISNWDIDLVQNTQTWSDEMYRIYGINKDQVRASDELFLSYMHPDDADFARKELQNAFGSYESGSFHFRFIRSDGVTRNGYTEWRYETDKEGRPLRIFGILQDTTEQKEAEENLKSLERKILEQKIEEHQKIARAIIKAQDKERNHIGRELHDNVNQILAAAKIYLSVAMEENSETVKVVEYPMKLIESSIQEIRSLCQKLVAPLKNINLKEYVGELLNILHQDTVIKTDFVYSVSEGFISDDLKLNIYRILQENIHNILKYAEAENVSISIKAWERTIHISITDDGKGFDVKKKRFGIGISNMISRVESFNGKMEIESSEGSGCRTQISIPY
jgi:PAS domain S-box-containing protein